MKRSRRKPENKKKLRSQKSQRSQKKPKSLKRKTIVQIVTGSIAAYKAGDTVQALKESGARVICVMTSSAKQFTTPLTLRALSGEPVYDDFWATNTSYDVLHTSLAEEADAILVSPASANFIARLAGGLADDLASSIVLASPRPVVIVPAMNDNMYHHPLSQRNRQTLKDIGYHFVDPVVGHLVCGREAMGHVAEPTTIVSHIQNVI